MYKIFQEPAASSRDFLAWSVLAAVAFLGVFALLTMLYAPQLPWNVMRLTPSASLLHGINIYPGTDDGVITGHIYLPLSAVFYALSAGIGDTIWATRAASLSTMLFFSTPFVLLARAAIREGSRTRMEATGLVALALLVVTLDPSLRYAAVMVHAEGPAAAFGLLAIILGAQGSAIRPRFFFWSGCSAAAAVLTKQTQILTWVGLGLAGALICGRPWIGHFLLGSLVVGVIVGLGTTVFSSLRSVYFNCIWIPAHHPWNVPSFSFSHELGANLPTPTERIRSIAQSFVALAPRWWPAWAAAVWILLHQISIRSKQSDLLTRTACYSAMVTLLQIPLALAGFQKIGGDVNALAVTTAPSLLLLFALALRWTAATGGSSVYRGVVAAALLTLMGCNFPRLVHLAAEVWQHRDPYQAIAGYLRAHPGEVYLPWNPLLTLQAEGNLYHFEYGVFDRALAGAPLSASHYRAGLPKKVRLVAIPVGQPNQSRGTFAHYLGNPVRVPSPPGLDQWQFFELPPEYVVSGSSASPSHP